MDANDLHRVNVSIDDRFDEAGCTLQDSAAKKLVLMRSLLTSEDQRGGRLPGTRQQVLRGSRRGRRRQHNACHLHQELLCRYTRYHTTASVPQQGKSR